MILQLFIYLFIYIYIFTLVLFQCCQLIIDNAQNEQYKDISRCLRGAVELKHIMTKIITQYTENKMKMLNG